MKQKIHVKKILDELVMCTITPWKKPYWMVKNLILCAFILLIQHEQFISEKIDNVHENELKSLVFMKK